MKSLIIILKLKLLIQNGKRISDISYIHTYSIFHIQILILLIGTKLSSVLKAARKAGVDGVIINMLIMIIEQ
jgi:hypothetical protein